jgi:uncharacterized protein YjbJ (UPF0337 family)
MSDFRNDNHSGLNESLEKDRHAAKTAMGSSKDSIGAVYDSAGEKASSLIDQAKAQVGATLSDQKDGIADRIDQLAETVHQSGAQFEGKQDWLAGAIDRGATELASLAKALRDNDLASLFQQVQSIARQQPGLFIGASLAAGFAVARLGKLVVADASRGDLPTLGGHDHAQA